MKYTAQNLAKALLKLIQENPRDYQSVINGFADFCNKKHLMYLLPNFFRYLKLEVDREEDSKTLKIFSAIELNESAVKKIEKLADAGLSNATKLIEDKDIVAGFVAYYQNKIIDASLSNNLRLLKNKLINT